MYFLFVTLLMVTVGIPPNMELVQRPPAFVGLVVIICPLDMACQAVMFPSG